MNALTLAMKVLALALLSSVGVSVVNAQTMYWVDAGTSQIMRANLDGSYAEEVRTVRGIPHGIALDVVGGKMYWTEERPPSGGKIRRANLDGANVENLVNGVETPYGIALDLAGGKVYWTHGAVPGIRRVDLDGTNIEDLRNMSNCFEIALDVPGGKMYWAHETGDSSILRANLDGSNMEHVFVTGSDKPRGIALDLASGQMYWTDLDTQAEMSAIHSADLDGSNDEDLVTSGLERCLGIALDLAAGKMYWTDAGTGKIQRADLDGSNVEDLITTSLSSPSGIALDIPPKGDCDGDHDIDLDDFIRFQECFTGPGEPLDPGCECVDFDGDGDVDCEDWLAFSRAWTGGFPKPIPQQCMQMADEPVLFPRR